jgi:8-oxo-dGTP pyrophosphatase MutT (NUDIX family)
MSEKKSGALIPAATIMLLRDGDKGLEVFMVVRHHQIDFASGALVFPGGKIDKHDSAPEVRGLCRGADGLDDTLLALRVGAIREAFEESGVLLAYDNKTGKLVAGSRLEEMESWREPLNRSEKGIAEFLTHFDLELACDMLVPFAHWITPDMMPKRFDTHFYIAVAPEDHVAAHDGGESVDSVWIDPNEAVREAEAGTRTVIFPTRMNLLKLGKSANMEAAFKAAQAEKIVTVLPKVEKRGEGAVLTIPAEAGYAVTEEKLENIMG